MKHYRVRRSGPGRRGSDRLTWIVRLVLVFALALVVRLFFLQIIAHGTYAAIAEDQYQITKELLPERGSIFARDQRSPGVLFPLGTNEEVYLVYAVPKWVEDPEKSAETLEPVLGIAKADLIPRLSKPNDFYEPLKREVPEATKAAIEALQLKGIAFVKESKRLYPEGRAASHAIGFVGYVGDKRQGQYGIEEYFEGKLAGRQGILKTDRDAAGRWITVSAREYEPARNGDDLVLTLDRTVQYTACTKLREAVEKHGASGGSVVILEAQTGAIVALCGSPDFDPNAYGEVTDITQFLNPAIQASYEPGSVFKPMTMSGAINEGKVTPQTTYNDPGEEQIGNYTIKNADEKTYGIQTMTGVLEQSINTGAIFAMRQIGPAAFRQYVQAYGFGERTGVELTGENGGNVSPLAQDKEIYAATAAFGQGITVTPLQLAAAYGAIANRGKLMKPYLVDEIVSPTGIRTKSEPKEVRQVIAPETATTVTAMLVNVVQNGHGKRAAVPGYFIGGKTGTAQVPLQNRVGYDPSRTIGTFAGILPADNPRFVMVTKIDDPKDVRFAESSAAPLFGEIAKFLVNYYQIPPTVEEKK